MVANVAILRLGFVNAYLLKAKGGFVLVDAGTAAQGDRLVAAMKAEGCTEGTLRLVVITHADADHCGGCAKIRQAFRAPIGVHRLDSSALETGVAPKREGTSFLSRLALALFGLRRAPQDRYTCRPDLLLEDGQDLDAYGLAARVIHLPGHTRGSIAILTKDGALFAGDVLANYRRPAPSPFVESPDEYRASLEKLKRMVDSFQTVYPGHGSPFPAGKIAPLSL